MATTAVANSFKAEVMQGAHSLAATLSGLAGAGASAAFTLTGLASTAGVVVGMTATGTGVAAGAIVASVDSATQVTVSKAHTGTVTSGTIAFTADSLLMLLIKAAPTRTFDATQTNIGTPGTGGPTATNVGTDEVTGTGYTSGGAAAVTSAGFPQVNTAVGITTFGNISWTNATISTTAGVLYNASATRLGAAAAPLGGRVIAVYDFGGTQTVTAGTLTLVMPTANSTNAILRIT